MGVNVLAMHVATRRDAKRKMVGGDKIREEKRTYQSSNSSSLPPRLFDLALQTRRLLRQSIAGASGDGARRPRTVDLGPEVTHVVGHMREDAPLSPGVIRTMRQPRMLQLGRCLGRLCLGLPVGGSVSVLWSRKKKKEWGAHTPPPAPSSPSEAAQCRHGRPAHAACIWQ